MSVSLINVGDSSFNDEIFPFPWHCGNPPASRIVSHLVTINDDKSKPSMFGPKLLPSMTCRCPGGDKRGDISTCENAVYRDFGASSSLSSGLLTHSFDRGKLSSHARYPGRTLSLKGNRGSVIHSVLY